MRVKTPSLMPFKSLSTVLDEGGRSIYPRFVIAPTDLFSDTATHDAT